MHRFMFIAGKHPHMIYQSAGATRLGADFFELIPNGGQIHRFSGKQERAILCCETDASQRLIKLMRHAGCHFTECQKGGQLLLVQLLFLLLRYLRNVTNHLNRFPTSRGNAQCVPYPTSFARATW